MYLREIQIFACLEHQCRSRSPPGRWCGRSCRRIALLSPRVFFPLCSESEKEKNRRMSGWSVVRASCRPAAGATLRWVGDRTRVLRLYRSIAARPSPQVRWPSTHRCGFFFDKKDFSLESPPVRRDRLIDPMGGVSTKLCATRILLLFLLLIYCTTLLYG